MSTHSRGGFSPSAYETTVINSQTINVIRRDPDQKVLHCFGTTTGLTDGGAGYAVGCIYVQTDGSVATTMYINEGTKTSCDFNPVITTIVPARVVETATATATADGLTTGAIAALTGLKKFVAVTSAAATDAITLPAVSAATIGQEVYLTVGANGYELLTVAGSNVTINQVDADGTNQLDVAANTTLRCTQISATAWLAEQIAATGITVVAPDND